MKVNWTPQYVKAIEQWLQNTERLFHLGQIFYLITFVVFAFAVGDLARAIKAHDVARLLFNVALFVTSFFVHFCGLLMLFTVKDRVVNKLDIQKLGLAVLRLEGDYKKQEYKVPEKRFWTLPFYKSAADWERDLVAILKAQKQYLEGSANYWREEDKREDSVKRAKELGQQFRAVLQTLSPNEAEFWLRRIQRASSPAAVRQMMTQLDTLLIQRNQPKGLSLEIKVNNFRVTLREVADGKDLCDEAQSLFEQAEASVDLKVKAELLKQAINAQREFNRLPQVTETSAS